MSSVGTLLEGSWKEQRFHPKSIPHLLHWDLAYLWVLARLPQFRPGDWTARITAWERLLGHFLSGKLVEKSKAIEVPLLNYTQRFGIAEIRLLHLRDKTGVQTEPCGMVSPMVLVRPLPDTSRSPLILLPDVDWRRDGRVQHCLNLILTELDQVIQPGEGGVAERSIQSQLRTILRRYQTEVRSPCQTVTTRVPIHRTVSFAPGDAAVADAITVSIVSEGPPEYVPRCDHANCGIPLTFPDRPEFACSAVEDHVAVKCRNHHDVRIPLESLYVWNRKLPGDTGEFVCWTDAAQSIDYAAAGPHALLPPKPAIEGSQIVFRWNPGLLDGDAANTALRIEAGAFPIRTATLRDNALYPKLLAPGSESALPNGLPIRFEWRDAWLSHESSPLPQGIQFSKVAIAGRRYKARLTYDGTGWIDRRPSLFVGIYPDRMHSGWKPYRLAALGEEEQQFQMKAAAPPGALPWVRDVEGWPEYCSVEHTGGSAGATFLLDRTGADAAGVAQAAVGLGIDFGTSNSVVYFGINDGKTPTSEANAIRLSEYGSLMKWISSPPPAGWQTWFLPSVSASTSDPYLVPSALWKGPSGPGFLRWGLPGGVTTESLHGFKWDDGIVDRSADRRRFLQELLFFSIPPILDRLGARRAAPHLRLGFSYPLAFGDSLRKNFSNLVKEMGTWCTDCLGLPSTVTSINESLASVKASVGLPQTTDLFLVADMGGRTLDIALFAYPDSVHQIGSAEFGGEALLEKAAATKSGTTVGKPFKDTYWKLRDAIQGATGAQRPTADTGLHDRIKRFHVLALEFLRVVLLRQQRAGATAIQVLLIGNGWRLQDLLAGHKDPARHLFDYATIMVNCFQIPGVSVRATTIPDVHSSKHWVAIGALRWAIAGESSELDGQQAFPSQLPAGRRTTINGVTIEWDALVGDGGIQDIAWLDKPFYNIDVDRTAEPGMTPEWDSQLNNALPPAGRYPEVAQLAEPLKNSIHLGRIGRGPLQLLLEGHWKERGL